MWKNKFLSKEIECENLKLSETREKELLLSIEKFSNELLIWKNKSMRLELESKDFIKKDEEINSLKMKINDLSKENLFLKSKSVEKNIDHTDFTSLNDQISKHLKEIINLREIVSQKELIIKNLQISNSIDNNYNYEVNSLKIEIENLRKQIIHKDEEIIKIKSSSSVHITDRKLIEELESWKHRCKYLENRENNNGKLIDYEQKIEYLTKELDMIRIQLNVKINEYNDIFYKYNEIKNNVSNKFEFEQKISYLTRELDTCKYELNSKITEYNNLLYQFNEIKSKNNTQISTTHYYKSDSKTDLLNLEIIKLQKTLKEKNQEIEYLKKTYSSFINKNSKEKSIIKYEETISLLQREIQEWKEKVANSNKYTSINFTSSVSENKDHRELKVLNEEIRSLKQIILTYEQEIETWKIKYLKLEKDIHEFAQIKNQEKEINLSHERNSPSKTMKTSYVEHEIIRKNENFSADNQFENKYFEKKYY